MKRALVGLLLGCALTLGLFAPAQAFDNDRAAVSFHITPIPSKDPCTTNVPTPLAYTMVTEVCDAPGTDYAVWFLVCNGSDSTGIAGMEFGIDYDGAPNSGVDVWSWTSCMDLNYPSANWPEANSGLLSVWDPVNHCQNTPSQPYVPYTVIAIGGYLGTTFYSPDQMQIIGRPVTGYVKVVDCQSSETRIDGETPSHQGIAGFCLPGYNPCGLPTPVETKTWGQIKQQYN